MNPWFFVGNKNPFWMLVGNAGETRPWQSPSLLDRPNLCWPSWEWRILGFSWSHRGFFCPTTCFEGWKGEETTLGEISRLWNCCCTDAVFPMLVQVLDLILFFEASRFILLSIVSPIMFYGTQGVLPFPTASFSVLGLESNCLALSHKAAWLWWELWSSHASLLGRVQQHSVTFLLHICTCVWLKRHKLERPSGGEGDFGVLTSLCSFLIFFLLFSY